MGDQASKILDKINSNQFSPAALIASPNNSYTKKPIRETAYQGYSAYRKDQVELILSTLDNNLREKKYGPDSTTFRSKQGILVLPQITKH